jgi:hypothetical protein
VAIGVAVAAAVSASFWAGRKAQTPSADAGVDPATMATPVVAPGLAGSGVRPAEALPTVTPSALPAQPSGPQSALPAPAGKVSVEAEFQRLMDGRSAGFDVQAVPLATRLRVGQDRLAFRVTSARDGHLYVLVGGPDGSLMLLFPNSMASDNRIRAGQTLQLPHANWPLETTDPEGLERFAVIVSEHARDFSHLGADKMAWFQNLPTGSNGAALVRGHQGRGSALAGRARCTEPDCDRYGATLFAVDVVGVRRVARQ